MKNILIAGASSSIGKKIVESLHSEANLITLSRSGPEGSANHYITDYENDIFPDIDVELDGLVYCPGTINLKPFRNLKPGNFREDFEINLVGAVKVINRYIDKLLKSQSASVVLFSSVAAGSGMPFHASIASSKAAIEGLTRSLAAEFAGKIRFNAVAPSLTDTPLAERLLRTDAQREASAARHPMKRIGSPGDIASVVSFLLSDESSWMTGQILKVDGGLSTLITK
ncbi:MAG: SDR family oxidoreductase [Bacteroidales bacterium]|nr:SDR family oxidoreductase [Bacteroidales bacterium]